MAKDPGWVLEVGLEGRGERKDGVGFATYWGWVNDGRASPIDGGKRVQVQLLRVADAARRIAELEALVVAAVAVAPRPPAGCLVFEHTECENYGGMKGQSLTATIFAPGTSDGGPAHRALARVVATAMSKGLDLVTLDLRAPRCEPPLVCGHQKAIVVGPDLGPSPAIFGTPLSPAARMPSFAHVAPEQWQIDERELLAKTERFERLRHASVITQYVVIDGVRRRVDDVLVELVGLVAVADPDDPDTKRAAECIRRLTPVVGIELPVDAAQDDRDRKDGGA